VSVCDRPSSCPVDRLSLELPQAAQPGPEILGLGITLTTLGPGVNITILTPRHYADYVNRTILRSRHHTDYVNV
jgi:hypothetical protein